MKKRNESSLVTACLKFLQCLENSSKIRWVDRLNSGNILTVKRYINKLGQKKEFFGKRRGCRPGTPDIFCILNNGHIVWIECKTEKGKQEPDQIEFENMVRTTPNHSYIIIKSLDDLAFKMGV